MAAGSAAGEEPDRRTPTDRDRHGPPRTGAELRARGLRPCSSASDGPRLSAGPRLCPSLYVRAPSCSPPPADATQAPEKPGLASAWFAALTGTPRVVERASQGVTLTLVRAAAGRAMVGVSESATRSVIPYVVEGASPGASPRARGRATPGAVPGLASRVASGAVLPVAGRVAFAVAHRATDSTTRGVLVLTVPRAGRGRAQARLSRTAALGHDPSSDDRSRSCPRPHEGRVSSSARRPALMRPHELSPVRSRNVAADPRSRVPGPHFEARGMIPPVPGGVWVVE